MKKTLALSLSTLVIGYVLFGAIKMVQIDRVEAKIVKRPTPTAICKDNTFSYALHHQGACSHHKGVKTWLK